MKYKSIVFSIILSVLFCLAASGVFASETIDLSGEWRFALDNSDKGVDEKWFDRNLKDKISLPGILQAQNFGNDISAQTPWVLSLYDEFWFEREDYKNYAQAEKVKVPFLSQPPKHYLGAAWYNREIEIPADWNGRRVVLFLERPHWSSTVWVDDKLIGTNLSLVAEHEYDLGNLSVGKHCISIRVDNRMLMDYRTDAHSVSDSLGQSWQNFREILFDTRVMKKLAAEVLIEGNDAANAIDGDPNTFWIAGTQKDLAQKNQELTIEFPNAVSFSGLVVMPRQNHRDHEGDAREYMIQTRDDGANWKDLKRGALVSTFAEQKIIFGQNISTKYLKFVSLSGFGADKTTAIADLAVIYTDAKLPDDAEDLEYQRVKSASTDIDEGTNADDKKPKKKP